MHSVEQISEPSLLAEGPHWDNKEKVLYYVDIYGFSVHKYNPKNKTHSAVKLNNTIGAVIPIRGNPGKFVIGYGVDLAILEWDGNSNKYSLQTKYTVDSDKPGNRFNDGKADINGNLWFGTMGLEEPVGSVKMDQGTLYRVSSTNCKLDTMVQPVSISNGITWNNESNIMYYIDSPTRRIDAFDYNLETATIENRRTFFDFEEHKVSGVPDGMTIDVDDNLWIACWNGSKVIQVSKKGELLKSIKLPVSRVTSVVWGGNNLDVLYVTSMRKGLTEEQLKAEPAAGAVFAITGLGVRGLEGNLASDCLLV